MQHYPRGTLKPLGEAILRIINVCDCCVDYAMDCLEWWYMRDAVTCAVSFDVVICDMIEHF